MNKIGSNSNPEMLIYNPNSLAEFFSCIDDARDRLQRQGIRRPDDIFFRGERRIDHQLVPTLLRVAKEHGIADEDIQELEGELFFEFQAKGSSLMGTNLNCWDQLFIMRHHRLPTRLLDWSESLGVSLYFSTSVSGGFLEPEFPPCVWLLNPYALNARTYAGDPDDVDLFSPKYFSWDEDDETYYDYDDIITSEAGIDWEVPVALYPVRNTPRVHAQDGWFTIHGSDSRPLELIAPESLAKVVIAENLWPEARAFARSAGLDPFTIYRDLDSLSSALVQKIPAMWPKESRK